MAGWMIQQPGRHLYWSFRLGKAKRRLSGACLTISCQRQQGVLKLPFLSHSQRR